MCFDVHIEHRLVNIPPCLMQQHLMKCDKIQYYIAKTICFVAFAELCSHQADEYSVPCSLHAAVQCNAAAHASCASKA